MLRRLFLAVLLVTGLASAALAEKRVALVLGAEKYRTLRPLDNPVNDATGMQTVLESLGFEVYLELDRDLKRMRRALEDFRTDAMGADVALVFFAGHGVAIDGVNYLLPVDAEITSSTRLAETSMKLEDFQSVLEEVSSVGIMMLDACRNDPFNQGGGSGDGRGAVALAGDPPEAPKPASGQGRVGRADGVLFAFAASPGDTASDGDGANSPFTAALLRLLATPGVELKSALTLVQQDVYDRTRGKQLPYIESGLPELVFISQKGDLSEREQLLTAMAGLTPDLRTEVESVAAANNMPLAPLYAALISGELTEATPEERRIKLQEAAASYADFQTELAKYASDDPKVADLRAQAEEQLTLGAFEAARALLTEAAGIDSTARLAIKNNYLARTLSEAGTHVLNANAARTDLRYDLAIADLTKAVELYAEVEGDLPDREARENYLYALTDLGALYTVSGNSFGALGAHMTRSEFAQGLVQQEPMEIAWTREVIWALNDVGSVLQQQGYLTEAEEAFVQGYDLTTRQTAAFPDNPDLLRDRQVLRNKLGEVRFAQNDFAGALEAYQEALAIAEQLLDSDPTRVTYLRDVAFTQERIGDVHVALGDYVSARAAFDVSMRISQDLSAEFPDDLSLRRDVSVAYERLGDMMIAEEDYDSALAAYLEALKMREDLALKDPSNVMLQRDTSVTVERIGDIYALMGDVGSALMSHNQAMGIRETLVALDPSNVGWARDLSISYERVGELHFREGDYQGALEAYERCRDVRQTIVALDPSNLPRQRDLAVAMERVALSLGGLGQTDAALATHGETLALRRELAAADPSVVQYRRDITYSLLNIADIRRGQGDTAGVAEALTEAVALRRDLAEAAPEDYYTLRDLTVAQNDLVDALISLGDPAQAVAVAQDSLSIVDLMLGLRPADSLTIRDRLVAANRLGDAQRAVPDWAAALSAYQIMAEAGYQLSSADPYNQGLAADYALALERMGDAQVGLEDRAAARVSFENALAIRQWLSGQDPQALSPRRSVGYVMQKLADTHYFDANYDTGRPMEEQALALFRDVLAAEPDNHWNVIDVVTGLDRVASYYDDRTAQYVEALGLLEGLEAQGLLPGGYDAWMDNYRKYLGG